MKKFFLYVIGGHYGDEAKGKVVDSLAKNFDIVVRGSGGNNAGHTVKHEDKTFAFHLLPSGVLYPNTLNILGMEMMINPTALISEINEVKSRGFEPKIKISTMATVVTDWHIHFDAAQEEKGKGMIGTTKRGIGPAAESKYNRKTALRIKDLVSNNLEEKILDIVKILSAKLIMSHPRFQKFSGLKINELLDDKDASELKKEFNNSLNDYAHEQAHLLRQTGDILKEYFCENVAEEVLSKNVRFILGEGAQGTMLDPTFGELPYTTSTPTTAASISRGMAFEPRKKDVICVFKAYETRVGEGPFATELGDRKRLTKELEEYRAKHGAMAKIQLNDEEKELINSLNKTNPDYNHTVGKYLLSKGNEYGTTTGRPRRCGWFNLDEAVKAKWINGMTWVAITKLDVLDELKEIQLGIKAHKNKVKYKSFTGWGSDTTKCRSYDELPQEAKDYLNFMEKKISPIAIVSVGPDKEQTIFTEKFKTYLKKQGVKNE